MVVGVVLEAPAVVSGFNDIAVMAETIGEPSVELVVVFEPQPRREEALADKADLVLNLPLLPAGTKTASTAVFMLS